MTKKAPQMLKPAICPICGHKYETHWSQLVRQCDFCFIKFIEAWGLASIIRAKCNELYGEKS